MPTDKQRFVTAFGLLAIAIVFLGASYLTERYPETVRVTGSAVLLILAGWGLRRSFTRPRSK